MKMYVEDGFLKVCSSTGRATVLAPPRPKRAWWIRWLFRLFG